MHLKYMLIKALTVLVGITSAWTHPADSTGGFVHADFSSAPNYQVSRVIDGDTVELMINGCRRRCD